ncbi:ORF6C domain-containing protein [Rummeliibacillus stabekisii]|uniref:ORF6C domain-containing protein n=1 Tax=Rummeliibacillus stabekisii TaxID=241244 RepID=UPI0037229F2C
MNELQLFNFDNQDVRILEKDGEPWFVGKDVAQILGYQRPDNAIRNHVDEEDKLMHQISASGQNRNMTLINESGMYSLVLSSKLESAKRFKRWVTSDVLPQIRKTGAYTSNSMELALQAALDHERKINAIEEDVDYLKNNMRIDSLQQLEIQQTAKRSIAHALGGKESVAYKEISKKAFIAFWNEFKQYFKVPRYGDLPKIKMNEAIRFIELWRPSTTLQIEIDNCNRQMEFID